MNRSNLAPYALAANIRQYGDQASLYDTRITRRNCDFRVKDSGSIEAAESPNWCVEVLTRVP